MIRTLNSWYAMRGKIEEENMRITKKRRTSSNSEWDMLDPTVHYIRTGSSGGKKMVKNEQNKKNGLGVKRWETREL